MAPDVAAILAQARRACVTAAAGCGKTEAIAAAVSSGDDGRQLILTHTHAGVRALRQRLEKYKVPKNRYHVDTIAGWALTYAVHYPQLSGHHDKEPTGESWRQVYPAAARVLDSSAVRRVVTESYVGLYVDEYQDCTLGQHRLILKLAELLPCRVLGDPLQGIFGFKGDALVDWVSDVEANFERLPDLDHPWRWATTNPALGRRLQEIRSALLSRQEIDLQSPPVVWQPWSPDAERRACFEVAAGADSVVAIHKWAPACHALASRLKERFTAMEEMDCQDLLKWASLIDQAQGPARAFHVAEFATVCMTAVGPELATVRGRLAQGSLPEIKRVTKHREAVRALINVASASSLDPVAAALKAIDQIPQRKLYRRELWREMERALQFHARNPGETFHSAAWKARNRTRHAGRPLERRTVSRTLLVKGLEFDHALVLKADDHDAKNFYVAVTRGARTLTVLSKSPRMRFHLPG